jgi:hypothetical protein
LAAAAVGTARAGTSFLYRRQEAAMREGEERVLAPAVEAVEEPPEHAARRTGSGLTGERMMR